MREIQGIRGLLQMIVKGRIECRSGRRHNSGIDYEVWPAFGHGCLSGSRPGNQQTIRGLGFGQGAKAKTLGKDSRNQKYSPAPR